MQASKGAVRQAGKELSKEDKQKARETAQMEKQASKEGKKRARDDSKPAKASGRSDPAAKKYALCACSISHHNDVRSAFNKDTMRGCGVKSPAWPGKSLQLAWLTGPAP